MFFIKVKLIAELNASLVVKFKRAKSHKLCNLKNFSEEITFKIAWTSHTAQAANTLEMCNTLQTERTRLKHVRWVNEVIWIFNLNNLFAHFAFRVSTFEVLWFKWGFADDACCHFTFHTWHARFPCRLEFELRAGFSCPSISLSLFVSLQLFQVL